MKILLVDDEADLRELAASVLESRFGATVLTAESVDEGISLVKANPDILCVVSDFLMPGKNGEDLYRYLHQAERKIPFILCTGSLEKTITPAPDYPVLGYVTKPDMFTPLVKLIDKLVKDKGLPQQATETYYRVNAGAFMKIGSLEADVFIKLSDDKYVRIFKNGDRIEQVDIQKYADRKIKYLYVRAEDGDRVLSRILENLPKLTQEAEASPEIGLQLATHSLNIIKDFSTQVGFTPETKALAKAAVTMTIRAIEQNAHLKKLANIFDISPDNYVPAHSTATLYVACGIAQAMDTADEPTYFQLSMAAFLHDLPLENSQLAQIQSMADLSLVREQYTDAEVQGYLDHPDQAAKFASELKDVPPSVAEILRQHHELPDGSGFPGGLKADKIHPLTAIFRIAHLIVDDYSANPGERNIQAFLKRLPDSYRQGRYLPVLKALEALEL